MSSRHGCAECSGCTAGRLLAHPCSGLDGSSLSLSAAAATARMHHASRGGCLRTVWGPLHCTVLTVFALPLLCFL
jgi:hypothetical protein